MKPETRKRIIGLLVFVGILALPAAVLGAVNIRSEAAVERESTQKQSETYVPTCDGKAMQPGDACVRVGAGSGGSYTYEQDVARHEQDSTVDGVRSLHRPWRNAGFGAMLFLLLVAVVLLVVLRRGGTPSQNDRSTAS